MRTFHGRIARVRCLAYSPDGTMLVSGGKGGIIRLWDAQLGQARVRFRGGYERVHRLAFSPDGSRIASASGYYRVQIWAIDGSMVDTLPDREFSASSIEFRPDGREMLASGWLYRTGGYQGIAVLWRLDTKTAVASFRVRSRVSTSTSSPDGSLVALGTRQAGILLWDPVRYPEGSPIYPVTEHPADPSDPVKQWVISNKLEPHCLRFSPDSRLLAATSGWSIHLYDVKQGFRAATLKGHRQMVKSLDFSPDGLTLASASHDGTVRFWDVEGGDERACFDWKIGAVDCAVFAPDGMTIAVGGVGGIVVWDVEG